MNGIPKYQLNFFNFLDVFLTGGLIAGGSDGVHKLIEVYRSFTEASTIKVKKTGS